MLSRDPMVWLQSPRWLASGPSLLCEYYGIGGVSLVIVPLQTGEQPRRLFVEPGREAFLGSVTHDGRTLVYSQWDMRDKLGEMMVMDLGSNEPGKPLMLTPESEFGPVLSPAGDLLGYTVISWDSGNPEGLLYVVSFPVPGVPAPICPARLTRKGWGWLGANELYWTDGARRVWSASLSVKDGQIDVDAPKSLFGARPLDLDTTILDYDAPRERFLIAIRVEEEQAPELVLVSDWRAELASDQAEVK